MSFSIDNHNGHCKDQFCLEPKTGMDSGPKSSNNKFVESGRKSQSESREKILVDSVQGKELHMHKYKKHPRLCPNSMINGLGFFLFFLLLSFSNLPYPSCFSSSPHFSFLFLLCTIVFVPSSLSTCESGVGSFHVPSRTSLNLLLLAVRLFVYCLGITSTLMRPESQLGSI